MPASFARAGMLRPSGVVKNCGKIVTTLILSGARGAGSVESSSPSSIGCSVIEQTFGRIDANELALAIDGCDDSIVRNEHRATGRCPSRDVERQAGRQLVGVDDGSEELTRFELDAHADELMD